MKGMLDPEFKEEVIGHAEVRQIFHASGVGTIAGSYVKDGKFERSAETRIIRDGVVDQKQLKRLRFTMDDLFDQLRQKDIFDISDVRYAIVETNGQLSVMLKPEKETVTAEMADIQNETKGLLCMVVNDGKFLKRAFKECDMNEEKIFGILEREQTPIDEVLFMVADKEGNYTIVKKDEYR